MRYRKVLLGIVLGCIASGYAYSVDGILLKTLDYSISDKWYRTKPETGPQIPSTNSVMKKQYFFLYSLFWNMATDTSAKANVVYDIKVTSPDGKVYFHQEGLEGAVGDIGEPKGIQLSKSFVRICFEPEDSYGTYLIDCKIRDLVNMTEKVQTQNIELREKLGPIQKMDDKVFSEMFSKYFQAPSPEYTLDAYMYYANGALSKKDSSFMPVLGFFLEILNNNDFLVPIIESDFEKQTARGQLFLIYLLKYTAKDNSNFLTKLTGDNQSIYQKIKDSKLPSFDGDITDPSQLDMLWGKFLASGRYDPILQLVKVLDYAQFTGYLEKYKDSKKTDQDRLLAIKDSICRSAIWSLKSNCKQYELVRNYCEVILEHENITDIAKAQLRTILDEI